MPYCYANGGGYGRFIERRAQPVEVPSGPEALPLVSMRDSRRPLMCVETGAVYPPAAAAARAVLRCGQAERTVKKKIVGAVVTGERANGYRWREVPA